MQAWSICVEDDSIQGQRVVTRTANGSFIDAWKLPYPFYRVQDADIDNDGQMDFSIGVTKRTRFDSTKARRIFCFKIIDGLIRPLWLGSRVSHPLEDFTFIRHNDSTRLRTLERESDQSFLCAEYRWNGFGFRFDHYILRHASREDAQTVFQP